ncbi:BadF/BadG/BcrA/BcrD ATPase family protein [Ideonella sp. BN130291]|uniref:BadF/BadG/BcrA/BcrD ATPase family protein n=1 Tax=Ideonella sp. BN130291 TaxID=3112940 RepID=UPI002E26D507|nr:BadF/BadG/BcrA/BcrD ATPase family protein [Ideonella sp. BN130291]
MDIRYIVGVDGGGTGTRARLAAVGGRVLGVGEAGPSALGQGVAQAWQNVQRAIARAFENAGLVPAAPGECALGLGLSGAHVRSRCDAFVAAAPPYGHVLLSDDGSTSLYGALRGQPGAVVAAGTGSIGEALRADGKRVTVGGWGFGVGDEGSGAWLGLRAVRHAHRAQDGRVPPGPLAHSVWAIAGHTREALLAWSEAAGQADYASMAPLVFDHEADDPVAAALLEQAVQALEQTAHALDPSGSLPLVITGSLGQRLQPRFAPSLRARFTPPLGDSADGALYLVRQQLDGAR